MRETCPKGEYLEINIDLLNLANEILDESEISKSNKLSEDLASSKKPKELARLKLQEKVGTKPKRPMFYLHHDLSFLPHHTRSPIRDFGDYIDHLIKFCSAELLNDERCLKKSLGINLKNLKDIIPEDLRLKLIKYNNLIYVPAKHDFNVKDRRHRFTSKEVVFICFITLKLDKEIMDLSNHAKDYAQEKINDQWADMQIYSEEIEES